MLDDRQKRAFIALACKVAWADGVVADAERAHVAALVQRLGGVPVSREELDTWLATGAPPAELADLPEAVGEMFIYDALQLIQTDGAVADEELALIETLMARVAKRHDPATPLARITLAKSPR